MQSNDQMYIDYLSVFALKKTIMKSRLQFILVTRHDGCMTAICPVIPWWSTQQTNVGITRELRHLEHNFEMFDEYMFDFNLSKIT